MEEPHRAGLEDLVEFGYVWVVSWLDRPHGPLPDPYRVRPPLRSDRSVSLFATRCPIRHNPIGFSLSELIAVDVAQGVVEVRGLDLLDGTPVLDLKPYVPPFDRPQGAVPVAAGWYDEENLEAPLPLESARAEAVAAAVRWTEDATPFVILQPFQQHGPGVRAGGELCVTNGTQVGGEILGGAVRRPEILATAAGARASPGPAAVPVAVDTKWAGRHGLGLERSVTTLVVDGLDVPAELWERLREGVPVALAVALDGDRRSTVFDAATASGPLADVAAVKEAAAQLLALRYEAGRLLGDLAPQVGLQTFLPTPRLVLAGWPALASVVAEMARPLGWRCLKAPVPEEALALTHQLTWRDAVVVLGHGSDLDEPVLKAALRSGGPGFVGATGSKGVVDGRRRALAAAGVLDEHIARLHAPVGLPLGGKTSPEIALSIVAELQAYRYGS